MASANRHKKTLYWFQTVMLRVIDLAAMNCRAIYKLLGVEYTMTCMKRILAYRLAAKAVRKEMFFHCDRSCKVGGVVVGVYGSKNHMNGKFHYVGVVEKRKSCAVHVSVRCRTNKVCISCGDVPLCGPEAWSRYHCLNNYYM